MEGNFPADEALTRKLSESALDLCSSPWRPKDCLERVIGRAVSLLACPTCARPRDCSPERTERLAKKSRELSHQGKNEPLKSGALSRSQIASSKIILHIMK